VESAVAVVSVYLARIVLRAALALRFHFGALAWLVIIAATAATTTAHLLDAALRHHLVAVAVVEAHIVCAVAIVFSNLASVVLRAALAASFDLVALANRIVVVVAARLAR
jgi:hypothetical protein